MARKVPRLGKGLDALLGGASDPRDGEGVVEIGLPEIKPNRFQPRRSFSEEKLQELAESIRVHGVVQPIIVRREDDYYELVAGERRWRAAKIAGLSQIPAIVGHFDERQLMEISLVENLQREDLNPMEQAGAYQSLQQQIGLTQSEVAERIGVSRSQIANVLRLLQLPDEVQDMVRDARLGLGHAKVILGIGEADRVRFARDVVSVDMTVRQAEKAAEAWKARDTGHKITEIRGPVPEEEQIEPGVFVQDVEQQIGRALGTRVSLRDRQGKGRIVIEYFDYEDLQRILDIIRGR